VLKTAAGRIGVLVRAARRAAGLENAEIVQQTLIHLNEINEFDEQPVEVSAVPSLDTVPCDKAALLLERAD